MASASDSASFRGPLRPLLPSKGRKSPLLPAARKTRAAAACIACRSRRSKCSAERPSCVECISRKTSCRYAETHAQLFRRKCERFRSQQNGFDELLQRLGAMPEDDSPNPLRPTQIPSSDRESTPEVDAYRARCNALKEKNRDLEMRLENLTNLYRLLQHTSEEAAMDVFQHIRQGMPPGHVPALTVRLLSQDIPSPNMLHRKISPLTNSSFEFELCALHPNVYPALVPLDVNVIDWEVLGVTPFNFFHHGTRNAPSKECDKGESIDARLSRIDIRHWTDIAIPADVATRALGLYLVNDTPWWAYFNIDLFLEDMANGKTRFCSRLLVNSVLSWACQAYAYYEPAAFSLVPQFLDKASQIYNAEKHADSLTSVAATSLMCMTWIMLGKDKIGKTLLVENASMAERLHLYNVPPYAPQGPLDLQDDDVRVAAAATAWGSFNFQMLMSTSYRSEPFAKMPPHLPIPGDVFAEGSTSRPLTPYQSPVYTSVCKFWSITYEMNYQYFYKGVISLATAEPIFQKLLAWADNLQEDIKRGEHSTDRVINLHIWFHTVLLDLFRPFADFNPQPALETFSGNGATPTKVIEASIIQLKRIIYNYRTTSQSANHSIIWQRGLLYLVNYILHDFADKEAHFYFLLCMRGYQNLASTIPWIGGVVQSLAAMAVRLGTILPEDAVKLFTEIEARGRSIQDYKSTYPVDLFFSPVDLNTATLEHLVHEFRNMGNLKLEEPTIPQGWKGDSVALYTTLMQEDNEMDVTAK